MRSGSFAGSVLKRRWISLRRALLVRPSNLDTLLGAVGTFDRLFEDRLQVALRALTILREDQDAPMIPGGGRAVCLLADGRQAGAQVLTDPVDQPCDLGVG